VRRRIGSERRKGVAFIKEIVPRRAIAFVARSLYNENYICYPMRSSATLPGAVRYEWRRDGNWEGVSAVARGEPFVPAPDSEETFITEHYWGYAGQRDGATMEYGVEHPPWRVWHCDQASLNCDVSSLYGAQLARFLAMKPASAFLPEGSPVIVRRGIRI
jgi:hypothetical protein